MQSSISDETSQITAIVIGYHDYNFDQNNYNYLFNHYLTWLKHDVYEVSIDWSSSNLKLD